MARGERKQGHSSRQAEAESIRDSLLIGQEVGKEHTTVLESMDRIIIAYEIQ